MSAADDDDDGCDVGGGDDDLLSYYWLAYFCVFLLLKIQDPTNGYYNVRDHDDIKIHSSNFSEYTSTLQSVYTSRPSQASSLMYGQQDMYDYSPQATQRLCRQVSVQQTQNKTETNLYLTDPLCPDSHFLPATNGRAFTSYMKPNISYEKMDVYEQSDEASKVSSSSHLSYESSHISSQQSDYSKPSQRMQTHVWNTGQVLPPNRSCSK